MHASDRANFSLSPQRLVCTATHVHLHLCGEPYPGEEGEQANIDFRELRMLGMSCIQELVLAYKSLYSMATKSN